jgi:two-component system, chemotaxis family, response regulator PixG
MNNDLHYSTAVDPLRNLIGRLQYLNWGEFTGVVDITVSSGRAWEIIFYQGKIVWSLDLAQPNRLWERLLHLYVGYQHVGLELLFEAKNCTAWTGFETGRKTALYYQGAIALMKLAEITAPQLTQILTTAAQETIFDLLQYSQGQKLTFRSHSEIFVDRPPVLVNTEEVIAQAELMWQEWDAQKLGNVSPNKTPVIKHPVQLYRQTTPIIYQNLIQVITGKQTLREIAAQIDEDLLLLTRSLTRYIQTGIIELVDLTDLQSPGIDNKLLLVGTPTNTGLRAAITEVDATAEAAGYLLAQPSNKYTVRAQKLNQQAQPKPKTPSLPSKLAQSKLVICIDDSAQVCELMRSIITDAGYRFISIQDATQALPRLLENKPDLIFLDLMMPKINGYEICGQIRRVSTFANIPIIILTGKDGLLDRLRSKVVGASEFICKPITRHAINTSLTKYLRTGTRD